ncbi:SDR family oxidoreductase [Pantoea agglomerans]|uniref:SDR family oxidoreductase n=1 Tax=Enterobacter agglomerans TaxID=549 RepID=A0ACC5PSJ3_ENTAG|nr:MULTISPECIES: SDR family oxidoreductase [Pantoea]KAF6674845.1 SDR family oxidoreductase [Pantoea sp. EKM21T]KAF6682428.1 SDR family oxidoreductase [Pantoea sp. EKM22T]MBD8128000.1 SDR family oxidoreductase [Pantoea agglomerans]MBD8155764.1 SDR family oxidoreductase [Pantoea agglomerans]MBD8243303.1 SDR family oxidoreductase [Pantoea agglomerans]
MNSQSDKSVPVDSYSRTALVLAGSSELGASIIDDLVNQKYKVIFTWWKNEPRALNLLQKHRGSIEAIRLDLSCEDSVTAFCKGLSTRYINTTIYCAGINPAALCDEIEPSMLTSISRVNFISATLIFNAIVKKMKAHKDAGTCLVYISSVAAQKVSIGNSLYGATKLAMERYLSGVAFEMARFNVRTLSVSPGYIKTRMLDEYCEKKGITLRDIEKKIPMRKMLSPQDVVNTIRCFTNNQIVTTGVTLTLGHGEGFI